MKSEKTFLGFQCEPELAAKIAEAARREDRSIASVIRRAVETYFTIMEDI